MKNKIIKVKGCKTCTEVLVSRYRCQESGNEAVEISAWHDTKDGWLYQWDHIEFTNNGNDTLMADRYVADFTEITAREFINSFTF